MFIPWTFFFHKCHLFSSWRNKYFKKGIRVLKPWFDCYLCNIYLQATFNPWMKVLIGLNIQIAYVCVWVIGSYVHHGSAWSVVTFWPEKSAALKNNPRANVRSLSLSPTICLCRAAKYQLKHILNYPLFYVMWYLCQWRQNLVTVSWYRIAQPDDSRLYIPLSRIYLSMSNGDSPYFLI